MPLAFARDFDAPPGVAIPLSARVTRLLAPNPGPFTFRGTGVYLVGDAASVMVIDPGPDTPAHLDALKRAIGTRRVSHILITHTHRDHSPAAAPLKAWSHAKTYAFGPHGGGDAEEGGDYDFVPDMLLKDGDVLLADGVSLTALHTPGHAANHLCFALAEERALFTGDHVMGWSTSVIAPPDGDMAAYMESLARLIGRGDALLYPTHGAPIADPQPYLKALLAHRVAREAQVMECLARGMTDLGAMVEALYPGIAPGLRGAAALTLTAHLQKLQAEGRVTSAGRNA